MQRQKIYLRMKDPKEALEIFFTRFNPEPIMEAEEKDPKEALEIFFTRFNPEPIMEAEEIPVLESPGRITAHRLLIILQQWMG